VTKNDISHGMESTS